MSRKIRQYHRWLSIVFTATVVVGFLVAALDLPEWLFFLPLPPLFLLMFSGLYLFALPYRRRKLTV